jgi:hypothetical protein
VTDLSLRFGGDLQVSASGDLLLATGPQVVKQRILRRLLTNAGDYIFQIPYGAGLRKQVGQDSNLLAIQNIVRSQIFAEADVAQVPAPVITATQDATGNISVSIEYTDAATNTQQTLSFPVT